MSHHEMPDAEHGAELRKILEGAPRTMDEQGEVRFVYEGDAAIARLLDRAERAERERDEALAKVERYEEPYRVQPPGGSMQPMRPGPRRCDFGEPACPPCVSPVACASARD